jgi:hypothetical protein
MLHCPRILPYLAHISFDDFNAHGLMRGGVYSLVLVLAGNWQLDL